MPWPMMPAPITPTDLDRPRLDVAAVDAGVFLVAIGEEENVDQRAIDRRAEQLGHRLRLRPRRRRRRRARPRRASISSAASGAGYCPLVCCWMMAEAVAPRKPSSVSLISIGPLQRSRSRWYCPDFCSARITPIAAASSLAAGTTSETRPIDARGLGVDRFAAGDHSTAFDRPTIRGARTVPPQPGNRPSFTSGKPNCALESLGHHPAVAPHRQLRAAADADAVDGRHGDERQLRQPLKQLCGRDCTSATIWSLRQRRCWPETRECRPRR